MSAALALPPSYAANDNVGAYDYASRHSLVRAVSDYAYDGLSRLSSLGHDLPGGAGDDQAFGFGYTLRSTALAAFRPAAPLIPPPP